MRVRVSPADALSALPRLEDAAERSASFRQAVSALGQSVRVTGPPPLDGLTPALLVEAVRCALDQGLVDDLDWITKSAAAVALYEITIALPPGGERRELGRRVFTRLYEGAASTFAAVAARMALGSGKPLEAATMRARIGLVLDLPIGSSVDAGALSYNLVARPELADRWVTRPAVGPLPSRRLAALLLEHAAREAVQRYQIGDTLPRDLLAGETVRPARKLLLEDREPLVWRHAAVARGLLATVDSRLREQIDTALDPSLSPTEWRRAAVSLVACLCGDAKGTMSSLARLLAGPITLKDPGLVATMVWGLPRVIEAEPDAAEELLDRLAATRRPEVGEALARLLENTTHGEFGKHAVGTLRTVLASKVEADGPVMREVTRRALSALDRDRDPEGVDEGIRQALLAFETTGAREAYELALTAAARAERRMNAIARLDAHEQQTLPELLGHLTEIDQSVLERSRLINLLLLGRRPGDADASVPQIDHLHDRLGSWLIGAEKVAVDVTWTRGAALPTSTRLRALLHLVDIQTISGEGEAASDAVRERLRTVVRVLLMRIAAGPDPSVHRLLCATLARALDASVREGVAEVAEAWLLIADQLADQQSVTTIAEASTNVDLSTATRAYAQFLDVYAASPESTLDLAPDGVAPSFRGEDPSAVARRMHRLSRKLSAGGTHRAEALRLAVLRLGRALGTVAGARGLNELISDEGDSPLVEIELAGDGLRRLLTSARRRVLAEKAKGRLSLVTDTAPLFTLVERAVTDGEPLAAEPLALAIGEVTRGLPEPIADAVVQVLQCLRQLPAQAPGDVEAIPLERRRTALPDWLLPRRTIGAYYVVRSLGQGGGASVFVARRVEERHDASAEAFALKVPQYDPTTARSLSEQEFMQMFREEATALLALPAHPNLARFVTFDLAARPKPILVMELIRGAGLDRLIRTRSLTTERAFQYLQGILRGLQVMHAAGVGHLDLKPSNVILRDGETPVLVDFGLSGRQLRPGCGTIEYCAPEVLGVVPEGHAPLAPAADIYGFGAMAFELLTGELLFDAGNETALAAMHVAHDGWPERLASLAENEVLKDFAVVIGACLRRDPRQRIDVHQAEKAFGLLQQKLAGVAWPFSVRSRHSGLSA